MTYYSPARQFRNCNKKASTIGWHSWWGVLVCGNVVGGKVMGKVVGTRGTSFVLSGAEPTHNSEISKIQKNRW